MGARWIWLVVVMATGCHDGASATRQRPPAPSAPGSVAEVPAANGETSSTAASAPQDEVTSPLPTASAVPPSVDGMLLVPAGPVEMGADEGGEEDEHPAHRVEVAAFYLDETEVTNEAYGRCVDAGRCRPPSPENANVNHVGPDSRFRSPRQPVSSISWDDAAGYCAWLGKRLPTEAEWERAARGDDARRYPWGDDPPTPERATYSVSVTTEVGTHPAGRGPFGHHDLAGNVWEWTADVYDPFAYRRDTAGQGRGGDCAESLRAFDELRRTGRRGFTGSNPIPTECERVLRGGAFNYPGEGLRATNRVHHPGRFRLVMSGFRCARDVDPGAR